MWETDFKFSHSALRTLSTYSAAPPTNPYFSNFVFRVAAEDLFTQIFSVQRINHLLHRNFFLTIRPKLCSIGYIHTSHVFQFVFVSFCCTYFEKIAVMMLFNLMFCHNWQFVKCEATKYNLCYVYTSCHASTTWFE